MLDSPIYYLQRPFSLSKQAPFRCSQQSRAHATRHPCRCQHAGHLVCFKVRTVHQIHVVTLTWKQSTIVVDRKRHYLTRRRRFRCADEYVLCRGNERFGVWGRRKTWRNWWWRLEPRWLLRDGRPMIVVSWGGLCKDSCDIRKLPMFRTMNWDSQKYGNFGSSLYSVLTVGMWMNFLKLEQCSAKDRLQESCYVL